MNLSVMAKPEPGPRTTARRRTESDPDALKRFGHNVAVLRVSRGMRAQQELANAAKVDLSTINDIENGKRNPGLSTIAALALALGVSTDDLILAEAQSPPRAPTPRANGVETVSEPPLDPLRELGWALGQVGFLNRKIAGVLTILADVPNLPEPVREQIAALLLQHQQDTDERAS